jgi:hypothetical protein
MSRKKKRSIPVAPPKEEKKLVIDMNRVNLRKLHEVPSFRTGRHMTEKDRPRKKDWKREYERGKEQGGRCGVDSCSFVYYASACSVTISVRA